MAPAARLGAVGSMLASLGGLIVWSFAPEVVHHDWIAIAGTCTAALFTAVYVFVPWDRLDPRLLLASLVAVGVPAVALAIYNTGGMTSPYTVYFVFIPFTAAYFCTRRELYATIAACGLGAAAPFAYDGMASLELSRWLFVVTISGAAGLIFHRSQQLVRASDAQLRDLALRDSLTGVANRRAVELQAERMIARSARDGTPLSVCYFDLDRFKEVNDTLGHALGDSVLRLVSRTTGEALRDRDLIGRIGGDEFVVLLPGAASDQAGHVAERIRTAFEAATRAGVELPALTMTAGLATFPEDGRSWEDLLQAADRRLLESKRAATPARGWEALVANAATAGAPS